MGADPLAAANLVSKDGESILLEFERGRSHHRIVSTEDGLPVLILYLQDMSMLTNGVR